MQDIYARMKPRLPLEILDAKSSWKNCGRERGVRSHMNECLLRFTHKYSDRAYCWRHGAMGAIHRTWILEFWKDIWFVWTDVKFCVMCPIKSGYTEILLIQYFWFCIKIMWLNVLGCWFVLIWQTKVLHSSFCEINQLSIYIAFHLLVIPLTPKCAYDTQSIIIHTI